jgi:hypothetical protein
MSWARADKIAIAAIIVAATTAMGIAVAPTADRWLHEPTATISSPADRTLITEDRVAVAGTTGGTIPGDHDLYLVICSEDRRTFCPVERIVRQDDGQWSVPQDRVTLDRPGRYRLFVYEADSGSSAEFDNQLKSSRANSNLACFAQIPVGAKMLASAEVDRLR